LNLALYTGPNFAGNLNQQNTANALANFFNSTGGIPLVFGTLTPAGLTQVSGETATGSQQTTFDAMTQFMGVMTDPFNAGRGDTGTAGASPFAEQDETTSSYAAKHTSRSAAERDAYAALSRKAPVRGTYDPRWSVWATGLADRRPPTAMRRPDRIPPPAGSAAQRSAPTISSRRTRWRDLRWPAAAPILPSTDLAAGGPTCSRPASSSGTPPAPLT
jgi:hypothetical protein